ncbi:DCC1-like thiol-disulfide oxidoreductase family protein [Halomarina ordinaria]|uniref:DCC1-like thiol-disulfide oxidoreductase family protein n=1 Tax=Halomarina ordinaria TaxID=3033939 RepID=A0ABD5U3L1_9EURY|nr:DCC1-like thiol-disulfide oxidoreductase family protein [Halomarina sp. PSRA2]
MSFVNYVADRTRDTPVNLAMARVVLAGYLVWRTFWFDWHARMEVPYVAFEEYAFVLPPNATVLVVEQWLLIATLLAVLVGYRLRWTATLAAVLVGHLATVRFTLDAHGSVTALFLGVYFLVFFALFAEQDELSADGVRRTGDRELGSLVDRLKRSSRGTYRADALTYSLLAVAILYFGSGFDKLAAGGLGWAEASNLSRILSVRSVIYDQPIPLGVELVNYPLAVEAMAVSTLVLELGLLVAVLARRSVTLFFLGLLAMKVGILLTMGIFFGDVFLLFALFLAWDRLYERLVSDRPVDLVFDERCYFCARSLYPFKLLDVNDTVTFYSQSDVPKRYRERTDVDFDAAMFLFDDGEAHRGYDAFRELLRQFRVFAPLAWVMGLTPVAAVGERVYGYVAENRNRHFTCSIDPDGDLSQ